MHILLTQLTQAMRNWQQQQQQLAHLSSSFFILFHALLLNAELVSSASSTSCSASTIRQTFPCSSGNLKLSFPFFTSDECDPTQSSFVISNCDPPNTHPDWPGFTKYAIRDDDRLDSSTVMGMYIPPRHDTEEFPFTDSSNRTSGTLFDPHFGYINLTWSTPLVINQSYVNTCSNLASLEQISDYIPRSINLQHFAHSSFKFDPSNIILLFDCNTTHLESSAYQKSLEMSSSACMSYEEECKNTKNASPNCYQYTIPNPSMELNLSQVMNGSGCKQAMFFVTLNTSLPVLTWKPGLVRLNWSSTGTDWLASTLEACTGCLLTHGSCGYGSLDNFQCFCENLGFTSTNCSEIATTAPSPSPHGALKQPVYSTNNNGKIVLGVVGFFALALFMLLALLALFCFKRRKKACTKATEQSDNLSWIKRPSFLSRKQDPILAKEISYEALMCATESFADKNRVGDGGFGAVYRAVLPNGLKVAVKRLHHDKNRRIEHFYNEIKVLSNLDHPNLVKLYGFCACEDEKELLLVFEYASHGTVSDHLHNGQMPPMPWSLRLNIACETANALSYLHNAVNPPIYHSDVKTTNILLDDQFHAKLADFGLSKLVPLKATHVSTSPQGTPGYLDPEYHQCYQLTDKSDVYSLGVVLMELISAKLAVDMSRERGERNLSTLAVMKIQCGLLEELVDPKLEMKKHPTVEKSINRVIELAFECLHACRDDRPTMRHVEEMLAHIRREHEEATATSFSTQNKPPSSPPSVFFSSDSSCPSSNLSSS